MTVHSWRTHILLAQPSFRKTCSHLCEQPARLLVPDLHMPKDAMRTHGHSHVSILEKIGSPDGVDAMQQRALEADHENDDGVQH